MNYFELYEMPVSFLIDEMVLKKKFFELSKQFHPDFSSNLSADKKEMALEMSTLNTNAYNTLKDFDKRMKYVLELRNILVEDEKYNLPQSFLMEMMELNEMDLAEKKNQTQQFESEVHLPIKDILTQPTLENLTENDWQKVKEFYFKKKYLKRIISNFEN